MANTNQKLPAGMVLKGNVYEYTIETVLGQGGVWHYVSGFHQYERPLG